MTVVQRLTREPNLILGVLVALFGVLLAFGVDLTETQTSAVLLLIGAVIALVRFLTTPASEVVAQQKPNEDVPVAGPAADVPSGLPVVISRVG